MRFTLYKHKLVFDKQYVAKNFIVLKEDNTILKWTDFHEYIRPGKRKTAVPLKDDNDRRFYAVIPFLNYVYFGPPDIDSLYEVNVRMVQRYMNAFGLGQLEDDDEFTSRSEEFVAQNLTYLIDFLDEFIEKNPGAKLKKKDLYKTEEVYSKRARKYIKKKVPTFKVVYNSKPNPVFRDLPEEAFKIIMNEIIDNHRDILMLAALEAFAGLRPGEACNVRREDSVLGPGIIFSYRNGEVVDVSIDLTTKYVLRSDLADVGSLKKRRTQRVYPQFLEAFTECYNIYMEYIENRSYETAYGPLTVNRQGKAYTYDSYRNEFQKAVDDAKLKMRQSDDPKIVHYSMLLDERTLGPHVFRHWFSVKLTLYGETAAGLQFWRGDSNPTSALTYLADKSDLEKQHNTVVDKAFGYMLWRAEKENGKS